MQGLGRNSFGSETNLRLRCGRAWTKHVRIATGVAAVKVDGLLRHRTSGARHGLKCGWYRTATVGHLSMANQLHESYATL